MPLVREEQIDSTTRWGLWLITESSKELEEMLGPVMHEQQFLSALKNETRKQHWLSYRILIRRLLKTNTVEINYHDTGKPFIVDPPGHLSVTHSGPFSAVIYGEGPAVGIDIERMQDRIEKIKHKFLSDNELAQIVPRKRIQHLVTLWAAKEAIYKLRGLAEIDFREHMCIGPFDPLESGVFTGYSLHNAVKKEYLLHYFLIDDYVLVWVRE